MVSLVNNEKWAPLIGELFLTFGSIEMAVQKCIKQWTTDVIYNHVKKDNLSKRIDLLINLVNAQDCSDSNKIVLIENLKAIRKLLEVRNTIAHSPLMLLIFQGGDSVEAITSSVNDEHYIEIHELESHVINIGRLYDEFISSLSNIKMENSIFPMT
ncbi:hypothetical protein LA366_06875 [Aeromonas jandaei]|uniref:RiboL-PSP-HEPN domain-containing protein n=1 Tax=Aeromonas jandaei TaxID=650 RepID=A0A7T4AA72_AERJA|nr:hypothetical protein [Aeromonas jandaei]QQB20109.1 hypothetical protein I6H43_00645 [Aeromonas jandaei]UCA34799.1 hypothetical protein LA366_06875 [Aeromonas jandaei]